MTTTIQIHADGSGVSLRDDLPADEFNRRMAVFYAETEPLRRAQLSLCAMSTPKHVFHGCCGESEVIWPDDVQKRLDAGNDLMNARLFEIMDAPYDGG